MLAAIVVVGTVVVIIGLLPGHKVTVLKEEMEQAADNGNGVISRQIEVDKGDSFVVSLYASWSTGMKWSAKLDGIGIIRQEGVADFTDDGPAFTIGSAGHEVWTFKALAEGETTITMSYDSIADLADIPRGVNTLLLLVIVG